MIKPVFEESFDIKYSEIDCNFSLKPSVLLQFMQDLATDNADSLGYGYSYISKKNLAWYLLKYHIEFADYPKNLKTIRIKTEPRGYNKIFALRDFEIFDEKKSIAKAISRWALVDKTTKSMTVIADEIPFVGKFEKRDNDLKYTKIPALSKIDSEKHFEIRYDDIDINKHANNTNYIIWALESLDYDFRYTHSLKSLDIVYKKEITFGDKIISQAEIGDNFTNHVLKLENSNEIICQLYANWNKI